MNSIGRAYVDGMAWLIHTVKPPFNRLVRGWHATLSRKINDWMPDGSMYFEYDRYRNTYIIATPHYKTDPDDYEIGHTAGKLSIVLGCLPLVVAMIVLEATGALATLLPEHWIVSVVAIAVVIGTALFTVSAAVHLISISVEMQITRGEIDAE